MPEVLIASDAQWVVDDVAAVLSGTDIVVRSVHEGRLVRPTQEADPADLVIVDFQIGSMGGMAVCLDLRLEESGGRIDHVPVLMLLDRRPDVFLARRSGAEGWLVKPLDPMRIRKAVTALLAGGTYHDDAHTPSPIRVPSASA